MEFFHVCQNQPQNTLLNILNLKFRKSANFIHFVSDREFVCKYLTFSITYQIIYQQIASNQSLITKYLFNPFQNPISKLTQVDPKTHNFYH